MGRLEEYLSEIESQRESAFDSREADLRALEVSLMERIEAESRAKREMDRAFGGTVGSAVGEIKAEAARDAEEGETAVAEIKQILEVSFDVKRLGGSAEAAGRNKRAVNEQTGKRRSNGKANSRRNAESASSFSGAKKELRGNRRSNAGHGQGDSKQGQGCDCSCKEEQRSFCRQSIGPTRKHMQQAPIHKCIMNFDDSFTSHMLHIFQPNPCTLRCLSLIHICRCRRIERCRSRWSPYH
eukprot:TRINITY_DN692_c0_g1_i5.p1 TRINITY_DN692_c0_g1~~TRINITY_DN692_c0_g1_i5.p1  ORF type:complete len:240 (+),score=34.68 TRINITY_DN692_c0_g1_i5:416-1135(+)